jgi:hypothetical protein
VMATNQFRRQDGETLDAWEARILALLPPAIEAGKPTPPGFILRKRLALEDIQEERAKEAQQRPR